MNSLAMKNKILLNAENYNNENINFEMKIKEGDKIIMLLRKDRTLPIKLTNKEINEIKTMRTKFTTIDEYVLKNSTFWIFDVNNKKCSCVYFMKNSYCKHQIAYLMLIDDINCKLLIIFSGESKTTRQT